MEFILIYRINFPELSGENFLQNYIVKLIIFFQNKSQGKFIERISGEGIMKIIQRLKQPTGENHTAWLVSNCEETRGAVVRKEFTDRLVKVEIFRGGSILTRFSTA